MDNIFDFQEEVALKVVEGLKIHLASDEKKKLTERGTENAEAYELYLKGVEYFHRQTKEGFQLAAQLWSEATQLDPGYAQAYSSKATALATLYRGYNRDLKLLEEGLALIEEARRLKPDLWSVNGPLSSILMLQGKHDEAEQVAKEYIRNAPQEYLSHFALGFFYGNTGKDAQAIAPYEEALKLKPDYLGALWNLVLVCNRAKEEEKQKQWAEVAIPKYEKQLKLFPVDEGKRVNHAVLLYFADRHDDARAAAKKLENLRDGISLYNTAGLHCLLKDNTSGLVTFLKAIEAGYRHIRLLKSFLENEDDGIGTLKGTAEWEVARELVEKIEAEEAAKKNG